MTWKLTESSTKKPIKERDWQYRVMLMLVLAALLEILAYHDFRLVCLVLLVPALVVGAGVCSLLDFRRS